MCKLGHLIKRVDKTSTKNVFTEQYPLWNVVKKFQRFFFPSWNRGVSSFDIFLWSLSHSLLFPIFAFYLVIRVVHLITRVNFAILCLEFGKQSCSLGKGVGSAWGSLKCSAGRVLVGWWRMWCPVMLVHFSLEPLHGPLPARRVLKQIILSLRAFVSELN